VFGCGQCPFQLGAGPVLSSGYAGDQETRGLFSPFLLFNAKSCPRIEIISSRCCSRTQSLLFPAQYLNFTGGWRLIDVAISFYSTSVKSKLPSQRCCCGDSSRKAAEQPSRGRGMVGGGQEWQAASDQHVHLVFKTSRHFSNCKAPFLCLFVPALQQRHHGVSGEVFREQELLFCYMFPCLT